MRAPAFLLFAACGALGCAVADPNNDLVLKGNVHHDAGADTSELDDVPPPESDTGIHLDASVDSHPPSDAIADTGHADSTASDSGIDSGVDTAPIDTGAPDTGPPPTDAGGPTDIVFPKSSDTHVILDDPYMYNKGDYVEGTRTTTLASCTTFSGTLQFTNEMYSDIFATGKLNFDVYLNGTKIGSKTIKDTTGSSIALDFTFAAIAGPTYDIKYVETNTVTAGYGDILITYDVTHVTLK